MIRLCFQYRLYPEPDQMALLEEHLEICRHLYNGAILEREDAWKYEKRSVGYGDQAKPLPLLKQRAPLLASVYSQVLQDCLKRLDRAYKQFFDRMQEYKQR